MKKSLLLILIILGNHVLAQTSTTSFLGIKIGESETHFLQTYPVVQSTSQQLLFGNGVIKHDNMLLHNIQGNTSSGDPVSIDCYFKNQKLAVICVEYLKYQYDNSILKGLAAKYGHYSKSNIYTYTDVLNGEDRTDVVITWNQFKTTVLEFDYTAELGHPHFIIADKRIQQDFLEKDRRKNISKIE